MNSDNYTLDKETTGLVKVLDIVPAQIQKQALEYKELFWELTLTGNVTRENRDEEQLQIDREATLLLKELKNEENEALAWGFMLYNEPSIVKIYWKNRVGKLRQDKREFFNQDKYLEWLTEIFAVLNGDHNVYHDPLYYFKLGEKSKNHKIVGDYDVMNSFRVHWNMYFLPILAIYLYQEDVKAQDQGISIEGALESENGAGVNLEAEMAKNSKAYFDAEEFTDNKQVEDFLKAFLEAPLNQPVPLNKTAKGFGVTYLDAIKAIVKGEWKTGNDAYRLFTIGPSIQSSILTRIKSEMKNFDITIKEFASYLDKYRVIAIDILSGRDVSFSTAESA